MSRAGLRVLHLLAPSPFGGLESVVRQLAVAQEGAGADVHVGAIVSPPGDHHAFVEACRADGLTIHPLEVAGRAYRRERRLVGALIASVQPDVVHTHGYRPDVVDAHVARQAGLPTVTTAHGFTGNDLKNRLYEWLQRRSFRKFDAVVAVSAGLERRLVASGAAPDRVHVLPNARARSTSLLDRGAAREALGLPRLGPPTIGWVGRIGPEKGPDVAVQALAEPDLDGAVLCMVGEGRALDACEELARSLGVEDRVRWPGRIPDAGRLMAAFDVLCLSSRTEGTPMVLFEADQAEVPVVATAVGGVPHVLGKGWNLVPSDDPLALAQALARAIHDPESAGEATQRARQRIERHFDPSQWAENHLHLYRGLQRPASSPSQGVSA